MDWLCCVNKFNKHNQLVVVVLASITHIPHRLSSYECEMELAWTKHHVVPSVEHSTQDVHVMNDTDNHR